MTSWLGAKLCLAATWSHPARCPTPAAGLHAGCAFPPSCHPLHHVYHDTSGYHAAQVRERFDRHVAPFLHGHPQQGLPPGALATYAAYMWATAVVSAYSFTIGR